VGHFGFGVRVGLLVLVMGQAVAFGCPRRRESIVRLFHNGLVLEALGQLRSAAIGCADAPVWSLTDTDLIACLDAVHAAEQAVAAVKLHLIRQAEIRDLPGPSTRAVARGGCAPGAAPRPHPDPPTGLRRPPAARRVGQSRASPGRRTIPSPDHRSVTPSPGRPGPRLRVPRLRPTTTLVRRPPHPTLDPRRPHQPEQRGPALRTPPPHHPPQRLGNPTRPRRTPRLHPTHPPRPTPTTPTQHLPPAHVTPRRAATANPPPPHDALPAVLPMPARTSCASTPWSQTLPCAPSRVTIIGTRLSGTSPRSSCGPPDQRLPETAAGQSELQRRPL
jgi:hypothetical protein